MKFALEGGLGNQILQYTNFCELIQKNPSKNYELDITWYRKRIGTDRDLKIIQLFPGTLSEYLNTNQSNIQKLQYQIFRLARRLDYSIDVNYFQNLVNYHDYRAWKKTFEMKTAMLELQQRFIEIYNENVIGEAAVHLRFGDYTKRPEYSVVNYHDLLDLASDTYPNTKISIFSDDNNLAAEYIQLHPNCTNMQIHREFDEINSFVNLAKHSTIFCVNSTFSLTAALVGPSNTLYLPKLWKKDLTFPIVAMEGKTINVY
jgi:hypothetical protein